jgi:beta-lactamase regulating signal transducer with metallopeptidase domain
MNAPAALALESFAIVAVASVAVTVARRSEMRHALWTSAMAAALSLPIVSWLSPRVTIPAPGFLLARVTPATGEGRAPLLRPAGHPEPVVTVSGAAARPEPIVVPWSDLLVAIWGAVSVALLLRVTRSLVAARRLVRSAEPVESPEVLSEWNAVVARYHPERETRLAQTRCLATPATTGVVKPVVLLPAEAVTWPRERIRAVLAHELAHVARRDCGTQLVAQVACAVYWFNPLMWLAERRMAVERERACDEVVLRAGLPPRSYASALVDAARATVRSSPTALGGVLAMTGSTELEQRVVHILHHSAREPRLGRAARVGVAVAATLLALVVTTVRVSAATQQIVPGVSGSGTPSVPGDSIASPLSEIVPGDVTLDSASVRSLLGGPDSLLARTLIGGLTHVPTGEEDLVRARSRWALSQGETGALVGPLIERLTDHDWRIRAYAAWALGLARDARATPALIAQLDHRVWRVRAMAATALGDLGDARAREPMLRLLSDPAWQVRVGAVAYLGVLRDSALVDTLRLRLSDHHVAVRGAAQEALGLLSSSR